MKRRFLAVATAIFVVSLAIAASSYGLREWDMRLKGISSYALLPDGGIALAYENNVVRLGFDGSIKWQWTGDALIRHIAADSTGAVYAAYGKTLTKLSSTGESAWKADTYGNAYSLAIMEGDIFLGWQYGLIKYDLKGNLEWEYYRPEDC